MNFLDALNGYLNTAAGVTGKLTGADLKAAATTQAVANEAARQAAPKDNTQTYLIVGGAVALVLVAVLALKK